MSASRASPGANEPAPAGGNGGLTVTIRLFAQLRERAGTDSIQLALAEGATVEDALGLLRQREPLRELLSSLSVRVAVNRDYAHALTKLETGDELALIPPLSGGSRALEGHVHVRISGEPLSHARVRAAVGDPAAGAIVTFEGVTRELPRLEYEAYAEMADERIGQILHDCVGSHHLCAAAAEHRVGNVPRGEPSVIVAVSAAHRAAAFAAAREAIDRIKGEAPIWKREVSADGSAAWAHGTPAPVAPAKPSAQAAHTERLSHLDTSGSARMVDVSAKQPSERVARARARVRMSPRAARAVQAGDAPKGEVLGVARIAGIQAAKQTAQLIPLAHPLPLTLVDVAASVDVAAGLVELTSEARTFARTGVEMEALTACAVAALAVYDMVKGIEQGVELEHVVLLEKRGGRSDYRRSQ